MPAIRSCCEVVSGRSCCWASALGFLALTLLPVPGDPLIALWVRALLFVGLPLVALALVAGRSWTALFHRVGWKDIGMMFGFALLNTLVTFGIAAVVYATVGAAANPLAGELQEMTAADQLVVFGAMIPQLIGEELLTILPFLALLYLGATKLGWNRKVTIVVAWVATAILFGAIHLPTYDWNVVQCFVIIGSARIILMVPYLITKNVWVSAGAHILNDWLQFGIGLVGASLLIANL